MGAGYHVTMANRRFAVLSLNQPGNSWDWNNIGEYQCNCLQNPVEYMKPGYVSVETKTKLILYDNQVMKV